MSKRWIVLIVVGLAVGVVDQWTKFMAVKHLTPGFATAHTGNKAMTADEVDSTIEAMSFGEQFGAFFGDSKKPCRGATVRCRAVPVVDGFWNWRYVENPGAAWGILANASENVRRPFFLVVPIIAVIFIIVFVRKLEDDQHLSIYAMSLVMGGAVGNFIDRLHLSYVIDFIDWYVGTAHWPTFNFADAAISTGVGLLMLEWLLDWIRARKEQPGTEKKTA